MTTRMTSRKVTFRRPFVLTGLDEAQPAGTYRVDTEEELLDTVLLPAYRRLSTTIELRPRPGNSGVTTLLPIDPDDLDAALARDAAGEAMARTDDGDAINVVGAKHVS